jgi:hypothetical protein
MLDRSKQHQQRMPLRSGDRPGGYRSCRVANLRMASYIVYG